MSLKKARKCHGKYRFERYEEALNLAEKYMETVAMTFHPMVPYWCEHHDGWHIGHDSFKKQEYNGSGLLSDSTGKRYTIRARRGRFL